MRVLLLGGTDITLAIGQALRRARREVAVVTVPRDLSISFNPGPMRVARHADVGQWAQREGLAVSQFAGLAGLEDFADAVRADVAVAAGWYHMLPASIRDRFPAGCLGLHASLLPALRGHAPLNWAILAGLEETGVSLFRLQDGIDDGPIYGQRRLPIGPRTCIGELVEAARESAASLIVETLPAVVDGSLTAAPQVGVPSYCLSRIPEDGCVDWRSPVADIDRLVRAVGRPYPGAFSYLEGERITIWAAEPAVDPPRVYGAPGQLVRLPGDTGPCVVCYGGVLRIREATLNGGEDAIPTLRKRTYRRLASSAAPGGPA